MARYNRINLDGCSDTKLGTAATELAPGRVVTRTPAGVFTAASVFDPLLKYYLVNTWAESVCVEDAIPADGSINGEVLSNNRELAFVLAESQTIVEDDPLTLGVGGLVKAIDGTTIVAWASEDLTTAAGDPQLIKAVAA